MGAGPLKRRLAQLDEWLRGTRIVHLDDDMNVTNLYSKCAKKILKANMEECGENVKYDVVNTIDGFKDECLRNSLKAVVVDVNLPGQSGIKVVHDLFKAGIIKCPIFFLTGTLPREVAPEQTRMIKEMSAHLLMKSGLEEVRKHIVEFATGEVA
jgi:CheY-like chemotaxis protein